jgi:hypothetical protein
MDGFEPLAPPPPESIGVAARIIIINMGQATHRCATRAAQTAALAAAHHFVNNYSRI